MVMHDCPYDDGREVWRCPEHMESIVDDISL